MNDLLSAQTLQLRGEIASRVGDIEMGTSRPLNSGELGLDNFFNQVDEIDNGFVKLNKLLKKLQVIDKEHVSISVKINGGNRPNGQQSDAHEESRILTNAASVKEIKQRMEKDVDDVQRTARTIKLKIEALDRENLANRQNPGRGKGTAIDRSRTATTVALKKKFRDKIAEFQLLRQQIHQEHREVVERRFYTVTGTRADEETIDRLIDTGDSEQIFQKAIREQGRGQVLDTLAEIQERHDAVIEVERKLLELQQIFLDMAVLVDAQGELLDNIESHVTNAVDHVQKGNKMLERAKSLQKGNRKWMCIAVIIFLVVVAATVVGVLTPWKSS